MGSDGHLMMRTLNLGGGINSKYSRFEQNSSMPGLGGNGLPIIEMLHKSLMFLQIIAL